MAGDWIKMRTDLQTDPATVRIGAALGLDLYAVVGRLHAVWAWADAHADGHGRVTLVSHDWLDSLTHTPGLGAAMVAVGWLASDADGLTFPRFERHMGVNAKARTLATERKRKSRTGNGSGKRADPVTASRTCHAPVTDVSRTDRDESVTREEKRREEKKSNTEDPPTPLSGGKRRKEQDPGAESVPIPAPLDTDEFRATWGEWLECRRTKGKPVTARAARQQLADLATLPSMAAALACIRASIANDWQGLFPDKYRQHGTGPPGKGYQTRTQEVLGYVTDLDD